MNSRKLIISFFTLSLVCLGSQNILAGTVYQWTDEAGNVNFSDVPPNGPEATTIREISINQHDPDNVDFEKYSIINQVEQMTEWRRQLKEERLADRKLHLEEKRLAHEIELQSELGRQNQAIAGEGYGPRAYYYQPYQHRYRQRHGIIRHPHQVRHRPTHVPSRRNINVIQRRYGPVHL